MKMEELIKYCHDNAERKWETTIALFKAKRFADCLFFCHLSLEFVLKGKVVATTNTVFPITHDLVDLARKAGIHLNKTQFKDLEVINTFNIAGRYDDYKASFYKKATSVYAKKYYRKTKDLLLWLEKN